MARRSLTGSNTFRISSDLGGLSDFLNQLGDDAQAAIRPAAQAAAQVLYHRVKQNVAALGRETGKLDASIYQAFSPENSVDGQVARYHVSWNHVKAPHGHLVEYGYLQRYRYYQSNDGKVRPMVRPGMEDQPRPTRRSSQAEKDAYFVPLPQPKQVPGKAFVRNAASAIPAAQAAAEDELVRRLLKNGS